MPLLETRGAASVQGFGALAAPARNYIEDVFSTYLYTGNGSTQTITNGIDLSGKGGLVWIKNRGSAVAHGLVDSARGVTKVLSSNTTNGDVTGAAYFSSFNANGFTLGSDNYLNDLAKSYVSWTFREQAKFFDVVTYTGDGVAGRTVAHNLGSVPGCIIVKKTNASGTNWVVYHRSLGSGSPGTEYLFLNDTGSVSTASAAWNNTTATATVFTVGSNTFVNANGDTYVAYLFAHDAGGFGASGADNVISCGSFTGNGLVNLGWEPQWVMIKRTDSTGGPWYLNDSMRGWNNGGSNNAFLYPNNSNAESPGGNLIVPNALGFDVISATGATYIYIAIRRGPMKTPTTGTSVYNGTAYSGNNAQQTFTSGFVPDFLLSNNRNNGGSHYVTDRLRGNTPNLYTQSTSGEVSDGANILSGTTNGSWTTGSFSLTSASGNTYINYQFARAPGFFDVVCYTGTGVAGTVTHNLGVVPELLIIKRRNTTGGWVTYDAFNGANKLTYLNTTAAATVTSNVINAVAATTFTVGSDSEVNASSSTYVAYLFATCPGVSKVGTYTGTGNTLQIDCGFTGGARFVLIKRTDSTGDWYVWDSARGIVAGNDPYLLLNSTAAEVTSTDYVDTYSAGFEISSTAPAAINANGGSFIFLAIA